MTNLINFLVDSHHGTYVPQAFVELYDPEAWHVKKDNLEVMLSGPDDENYWEAWDEILNFSYFIQDGVEYRLVQREGDVFAIREPVDNEERQELNEFFGDEVYEMEDEEDE